LADEQFDAAGGACFHSHTYQKFNMMLSRCDNPGDSFLRCHPRVRVDYSFMQMVEYKT